MQVKPSSRIEQRFPRNSSPAPDSDDDRAGNRCNATLPKPRSDDGNRCNATLPKPRSDDGPRWQRFKNAIRAKTPKRSSKQSKVKPSQSSPLPDKRASLDDVEDTLHLLAASATRLITLPMGDTEPAYDVFADTSAKLRPSPNRGRKLVESPRELLHEKFRPKSPKLKPACRGFVEIQSEANGPWKQCLLELWTAHLSWSLQTQSHADAGCGEQSCQFFFLEPPCTVKTASCGDVDKETQCILEVASEYGTLKIRCNVEGEVRPWMLCLQAAMQTVEEKCRGREWSFVYLNVYDLHQDRRVELFNWVMKDLLHAGGAFHAGVEVFKREYYFGSAPANVTGISCCKPRQCPKHSFRQSICLGITCWNEFRIKAQVRELMPEWSAQSYDVLSRNCMTFCRALCRRIGVQEAPDWIDALPLAAGEHRLLQGRAAYDEMLEDIQVRCPQGHECHLLAQSFLAALITTLACGRCARELRRGEPRWHCQECDLNLCEPCVAIEAASL